MCQANWLCVDMETLVKKGARNNLPLRSHSGFTTAVETFPEEPAGPWSIKTRGLTTYLQKQHFCWKAARLTRRMQNVAETTSSSHITVTAACQHSPVSQRGGSSRVAFNLSFTSIGFLLSPLWASFASDTRSTNDFFFPPPCSHFNCRVYVIPLGTAIATCIIIYAVKTELVAIYLLTLCPGITWVNSLILWL